MDKPLIIRKLADEPRFLDKLGVYNPVLPLIAVPIRARGDEIVGVLAAQPPAELHLLGERRRFLEMIGNLIGQNVVLAHEVASDKQELQKERDSLRRKVKGESGFANLIGRTRVMQVVFDQARQVAKWNTTVLIRGESGTGIDQQVIRLTGLDSHFPADDGSGGGRDAKFCVSTGSAGNGKPKADLNDPDLDERERVIAALEEAGWVQAKAARLLNMTPRQIAYRIQILNIQVRQI